MTEECENIIMISTIPWIHYENFSVNNESEYHFLFSMVTWGKYEKQGDKVMMPLTFQISHAMADGIHCAKFFEGVCRIIDEAMV